ncbi:MAG TPA: hypothetical protein VF194_03820 [Ferrovibrio sp.]|uniref:hypothetical protein n=1 Tax=Ferrovibrio sp. TaxID=1917215 RepID=UPI002ED139CA
MPPDKPKPAAGQSGNWSELDQAARAERLAAKLRANLARRKQQSRSRQTAAPGTGTGTGAGKPKP